MSRKRLKRLAHAPFASQAYKTEVRELDVNRLGATYPITQASTSCAILPSWMGGHGISWENREQENTENTENMENTQNMDKMENISQMTATLYS